MTPGKLFIHFFQSSADSVISGSVQDEAQPRPGGTPCQGAYTAAMLARRRVLTAGLQLSAAGVAVLVGCDRRGADRRRAATLPRIGYLSSTSPDVRETTEDAFRQGLRELGYTEGESITIDYRFSAGQEEQLPALAAELLDQPIKLLVTAGPGATGAARTLTRTLPIVMIAGTTDPVQVGWIESLARPGGNLTGTAAPPFQLFGEKSLALLNEVLPAAARVAVVVHAAVVETLGSTVIQELGQVLLTTAQTLGVAVEPLVLRSLPQLEEALAALPVPGVDAVYLLDYPVWTVQAPHITALVTQRGLPLMATAPRWAAHGALLTYGPSLETMFRRAAPYVDKILRGANPAELPVEQPREFELAVNLRTSEALGVRVPPAVLLQATEVIR